jgi:hypothetical protein
MAGIVPVTPTSWHILAPKERQLAFTLLTALSGRPVQSSRRDSEAENEGGEILFSRPPIRG